MRRSMDNEDGSFLSPASPSSSALSPPSYRRPLGHSSSSPSLSALSSPSQPQPSPSLSSISPPPAWPSTLTLSPVMMSQPAPVDYALSPSLPPPSASPVLCCNVCSSPLAYQQGAQEQTTKQYFWYAFSRRVLLLHHDRGRVGLMLQGRAANW
jgi:hypothetical protein